MKKLVIILPLCVVAGGLLLSGCSKSNTAATSAGNNANETTSSAAPDKPVDMKIRWVVGKKYPMRVEMSQSTKTRVPNRSEPVEQGLKFIQGLNFSALKALDNGGREVELTFESERMDVSQGGRTVLSFDSMQSPAEDSNNPVAPILRAMIGARIQYFTDANGKVERVQGADELTRRMAATSQPQVQTLLRQLFSKDTLKQYASFADAMPGHVVKVGDRWPFKEDVHSSIGIVTVDMEYTFKNWEQRGGRQCAHVTARGNISTKTISATTGTAVEIKKGKITGEFWYDPALGTIVEADNDQDLALKISTRQQTLSSQFNQHFRAVLAEAP